LNIKDLRNLQKSFSSRKYKIRRNMEFGRLVTKRIASRTKSGYVWLCKCVCGAETKVPAFRLLSGHTKSCGCLAAEHKKEHFKSFYVPVFCKKCGKEYTTNRHKTTRGLCKRCNNAESVRAYRKRQGI